MPKRKQSTPVEAIPPGIRDVAANFIDAVNTDSELSMLVKQFEAAAPQRAAEREAMIRELEKLHSDRLRLDAEIDAVLSSLSTDLEKVPPNPPAP